MFKKQISLLFIGGILVQSIGFSQSAPVSQSANSMVNLITGDFHYELPVMTVTGPHGEQVPISFNYQGGIRMDDQASWIGLGWDYNPGEITHYVKGVSDDWKSKSMTSTTKTASTRVVENTNFYGPLYYKDLNYSDTEASMDVASSSYKTTGLFNFPDYDKFQVSGVGISGVMEPRLFDANGKFFMKSKLYEYTYTNSSHFTKSPNFIFVDELVYTNYGVATGIGYDPITNRVHTASYIEVFTNSEINTNYSALKAAGFLDYTIFTGDGQRRLSSNFDDNGIGAFRITRPNGMVYHYSLPVYMKENEKSATFLLNSSYAMDVSKELKEIVRSGRYAESWKLTAITGIDYVDVNNNGVADNGDSGYWIAYNYGMWTDDFSWRTPYYNFKQNQYSKKVKHPKQAAKLESVDYKNEGTVSSGKVQKYYLNSIQTSTQTAFFIKETRLDEHAVKDGTNIKPSLRLSKIVLMRNEDIPLLSASAALPVESGFSLVNCSSISVQPHIGNFNVNEMLIKQNSIAMVELITDYSLCKLVYNNIHNTSTLTSKSYPCNVSGTDYTSIIYEAASGTSSAADNNSGKLTLNEVKIYGPKYEAASPSTKFDYDQTVAAKNPNYNTDQTDYWGYYKSDFNFTTHWRYTTEGASGSANNVDVWSLKKITTPLAGEIIIDYESDIYNYVSIHGNYVNPQRYYLIQSATFYPSTSASWWDITVGKDINDFISSPNLILKEGYIPYKPNPLGNICPSPMISWGSNVSSTFLLSGTSTSTTQNFNMYTTNTSSYSGYSSCDPYAPPLVYDNSLYSGWGFVRLTLSAVPGGGTRVKQITIKDTESNKSYINEYSYDRGIAGSEPVDILTKSTNGGLIEKNTEALDPLVPPAFVTYTNVTIKSKSLNNTYMGKTVHEFYNSFEPFSVYKSPDVPSYDASSNLTSLTANYFITETKGILNNPKSVTEYNNADQIVSSALYEYQGSAEQAVGVLESFLNSVDLPGAPPTTFTLKGGHSRLNKIAQLKKITTYTDGIYSTEEYLAWDNITGRPTKTRSTNSTAGITEMWSEPAFRNASYTSMGPKSINVTYKNQLNEIAKVSVYRDKIVKTIYDEFVPANLDVMVNGTKTTWRQTYPKRIYDNTTSKYITQSTAYPAWLPYQTTIFNGSTNDATWKYSGETTIFNNRMAGIEEKIGSNRFASAKLGYNQEHILCSAKDAHYSDFSFTSFEDQAIVAPGITHFGGEFTQGQMRFAGNTTIFPHTGNYMAKVDAATFGPGHFAKGFTVGRSYRASVWVHKNSPGTAQLVVTLDGSVGGEHGGYTITKTIDKSNAANITVGDWVLITLTIDVPSDYTETGGTLNDLRAYVYNPGSTVAYYDDFMFRPIDAEITGNVIDEKTGLQQAELDKNNFAIKYTYDDASRIREIWTESPTEGWKLKKRYSYNFKRSY